MFEIVNGSIKPASVNEPLTAGSALTHVEVHGPGEGRLYKRRAIKKAGSTSSYEVEWLVASLNGVNAYITENEGRLVVVMTTDNLRP